MRSNRYSCGYAALLTSLCVLFFAALNSPADQENLLTLVRAGHRAARQSIHSFSAIVTKEVTYPNQPKIVQTGKYWRSLDVVRLQEKVGSGSEDYLLRDSEIRQVGRGPGAQPGQTHYGAARKAATEFLGPLDVWSEMMIDFGGPNGGHYDLDRFLEFAKEPPRASREREGDRDYIRITFSVVSNLGVEQNITLWHDVTRNYLVRKTVMAIEDSHYKVESDILEFAEPLAGLFFPTNSRSQIFRSDERFSIQDVTLSDLQVNKPIPKSVFQLPAIPAGTELVDKIQGTRYPIDESWNPIGPVSPLIIAHFPSQLGNSASEYHSQSTTEERSLTWLLVSGSLVVLVLVCFYRVYRQFRSRPSLFHTD